MTLQDWLRNAWLVEHESSREEIALAAKLRCDLVEWLKVRHPELVPEGL